LRPCTAAYCSKTCQLEGWREHKPACKAAQAAAVVAVVEAAAAYRREATAAAAVTKAASEEQKTARAAAAAAEVASRSVGAGAGAAAAAGGSAPPQGLVNAQTLFFLRRMFEISGVLTLEETRHAQVPDHLYSTCKVGPA